MNNISLNAKISTTNFLKSLTTLLLMVLVVKWLHIEESIGLFNLMLIVVPGFIVNAFLPLTLRLPFCFLLTSFTTVWLFGLSIGLSILATILLLFSITLLPIAWNYRALLVFVFTFLIALFRLQVFEWGASTKVVTIVGILVMFRTILYLYEIKYEKEDPGIWKRLNYFFLLPNLIFFIFPIVDYKTFIRNHYSQAAFSNYKLGISYMFTGLWQLLLYRLLYYYTIPSLDDIDNIFTLIQYMTMSYALIVRLSGLFHFSVGIICLFGFKLPPTFDNYFLAVNFSDLWRRINIYWKDFVMKVFYYPIYFKFKKKNNFAVFSTIMIVFFFNWFFHAYQWFWIRGSFLLKNNDILFWAIMGLFVGINALNQKSKKRKKKSKEFSLKDTFITTSKILGMYATMSLLWSFWISPDIATYFAMINGIAVPTIFDIIKLVFVITLIVLFGISFHALFHFRPSLKKLSLQFNSIGLVLLFLSFLSYPQIHQSLGNYFKIDTNPIITTQLNALDQDQMYNGYYDELIVGNNINSRMIEVNSKKPEDWFSLKKLNLIERVGIGIHLKPNIDTIFKRKQFTTNEYGIRDKSYSLNKDHRTLRIALLGGSIEMGSGVNDHETFESLLEITLNETKPFKLFDTIECLNFAVNGNYIPQNILMLEQKAHTFEPDILLYPIHQFESRRSLKMFRKKLKNKKWLKKFPFLQTIKNELQIDHNISESEELIRLKSKANTLTAWGLTQISAFCTSKGIIPILFFLPDLGDPASIKEIEFVESLTDSLGFHFINLNQVFSNNEESELVVASFDKHPNAKAHRIIADSLFHVFSTDQKLKDLINSNSVKTKKRMK